VRGVSGAQSPQSTVRSPQSTVHSLRSVVGSRAESGFEDEDEDEDENEDEKTIRDQQLPISFLPLGWRSGKLTPLWHT
jgi:hypothetical protein